MYTLTIQNDFTYDMTANGDHLIPSGTSFVFKNQGNVTLDIPGIGSYLFLDLGDKKLDGYPEVSETWGVLVRCHSTEAYYRYEGGGVLNLTLDAHGTGNLSTTNGTLIPIRMDELNVKISGIHTS